MCHRLRLVEAAREADLVTDFNTAGHIPDIGGGKRQRTAQEALHPPRAGGGLVVGFELEAKLDSTSARLGSFFENRKIAVVDEQPTPALSGDFPRDPMVGEQSHRRRSCLKGQPGVAARRRQR